ncbi:hypothetical protein HanIR_Chr13g0619741 [Helianthus annuus]|nr:hypothetical protein HanIR_Chr13g0619741 [Helianthus annuus]
MIFILEVTRIPFQVTNNLDRVRGGEQNGNNIVNYWSKMAIFKGLGQNSSNDQTTGSKTEVYSRKFIWIPRLVSN